MKILITGIVGFVGSNKGFIRHSRAGGNPENDESILCLYSL